MSNKKNLLTESEVRRFMSLANIPALKEGMYGEGGGVSPQDPRRSETVRQGDEARMAETEYGEMEELGYVSEEDEMPPEADGEEIMGAGDGDAEAKLMTVLQDFAAKVKTKLGIDLEIGDEAGGGDMDLELDGSGGEEEEEEEEPAAGGEEESEEEEEEEEELDEAEQPEKEGLDESQLVETVLSRVTARLIAEAKKKKMTAAEKKKKEDEAKKKKEAMKKKAAAAKKKLEEANAPAPKSTMSNASAAGVAKAAGKADKGIFGVTSPMRKDDSFEKGTSKRGDKMTDVSASAEHTVSHGKKNLAIQGGNKKK